MGTTTQLDFSKLTLVQALDLAVLIEEEARDRYEELADSLTKHHTEEAAAFFTKMVAIEEKHRAQLEQRRVKLFGWEKRSVKREMIFDVEAPEYDEARVFMSVHAALRTALKSEQKAHAFFDKALAHVKDADVRKLFEELKREEDEHQKLVKAELAKLPAESTMNPLDYADDPVGED